MIIFRIRSINRGKWLTDEPQISQNRFQHGNLRRVIKRIQFSCSAISEREAEPYHHNSDETGFDIMARPWVLTSASKCLII